MNITFLLKLNTAFDQSTADMWTPVRKIQTGMTGRGELSKKQKTIIAVLCVSGLVLGIGGLWLFFRKGKTAVQLPQSNKPTTEAEDDTREYQKETAWKGAEKHRKLGIPSSETKESEDTSSSKEESEEDSQENNQDDQPTGVKKVDTTSMPNEKRTKVDTTNPPKGIPLKKTKVEKANKATSEVKDHTTKDDTVADAENVTKNTKGKANDVEEKAKKEIRAKLKKASSVEFSTDHIRASHIILLTHEELERLLERIQATVEERHGQMRNSMAFVINILLLRCAITYTAPDYPYKDLVKPWMQSDYRLYASREFPRIVHGLPMKELKEILESSDLYYKMRVTSLKEISPRPEEYLEASLSTFVKESFKDHEFKSEWIPMIIEFCNISSLEGTDSFVGKLKAHPVLKKHAIEALKELKETSTSPNFFYKRVRTSIS